MVIASKREFNNVRAVVSPKVGKSCIEAQAYAVKNSIIISYL
jgi:hypothetical protein